MPRTRRSPGLRWRWCSSGSPHWPTLPRPRFPRRRAGRNALGRRV